MAQKEYAELLHEFMSAVKHNYGEKVLIQGTASVVLAGLLVALRLLGGTLADHRFLFLGAGEAGTGIAELITLEMSKQTGNPIEKNRKKIWLVDSRGLIVDSRKESFQHFKKPWAHEHEPVKELIDAVKFLKVALDKNYSNLFNVALARFITTFENVGLD
ncbi:hypothetical protein J1N35_013680 [Gossypium stocksii]|uniref:Malic enzyme NAD-binding domain-containing protein n=1 Tax=Gossypium stocksii TaxID=47602 RepID=A0A9D3VUH0_9ROSI|nr:hypothetical protein J1N35_013680 [Gossypium stocksii]